MDLLSAMLALCPSLIIFPYLIPLVLVQCGEVYGSWNSYLCIFLQPPITAFLQGPNAQLITPVFCDALGLGSSLAARRKCSPSHKNNRVNCSFAYSNFHVFRNISRRRHILNRTVASLLRICLPSNNIHNNVTCSLSVRFDNKSRMAFLCEFQCSIAIRFVMSDIVRKDSNITCYLHRCETSLFNLGKKIR